MSNNTPGDARIKTLVEKLRSKMKDFTVVDRQGELMGEVKDLILDANSQLNLVVSRLANVQSSRLLLLISKLIQKIDPQNKSVFVDINKAEMNNLPEYVTAKTSAEVTEMPDIFLESKQNENTLEDYDTSDVLADDIIRLLEERLVVDRTKRKIGEIIVRKEIETRMVQVPVRREKLIIEQINPERKQLAEFDLGQQEITGIELIEGDITGVKSAETTSTDGEPTVRGEFSSPKIASLLLNAIALERRHGCKKVRVQIVVEDAELQKTYQEWVDRCSGSQSAPLDS